MVREVKLNVLIGIFIVFKVFMEEIVCEMVLYVECFIIFLLLNLMCLYEVIFVNLLKWIDGKVLVVIGSLFKFIKGLWG